MALESEQIEQRVPTSEPKQEPNEAITWSCVMNGQTLLGVTTEEGGSKIHSWINGNRKIAHQQQESSEHIADGVYKGKEENEQLQAMRVKDKATQKEVFIFNAKVDGNTNKYLVEKETGNDVTKVEKEHAPGHWSKLDPQSKAQQEVLAQLKSIDFGPPCFPITDNSKK